MNRQQRRAAQHKGAMRNPKRWQANPTAGFALIADRLPMAEQNFARCSAEVRMAWHHLCNGTGTTAHFDALATAMNICAVRAQSIGDDAIEVAERAQTALAAMQGRYLRIHRFGPDADALTHVPYGLDLYDELLKHSSTHQLNTALAESMDRIAAGQVLAPAP